MEKNKNYQIFAFEICDRLDIEQVYEFYTSNKINRHYSKCIFHNEKTPSLYFKNNTYFCFGCGQTGNAISLVKELFNIDTEIACDKLNADFGLNISGIANAKSYHVYSRRINEKQALENKLKSLQSELENLEKLYDKYEEWLHKFSPVDMESETNVKFLDAVHNIDITKYQIEVLETEIYMIRRPFLYENCGGVQ